MRPADRPSGQWPAAAPTPAGVRPGARPRAVPPPTTPVPARPPWRRAADGALQVLGVAAAVAIAWVVLVTLRDRGPVSGDGVSARVDAAVAETLAADHVLSVATWAGYVSTTLVLGGLVFRRFVARGPRRGRPAWAPRAPAGGSDRLLAAAVGLGIVAVVASLPVRAAVVTGRGLDAAGDPDTLGFVLTSPFGDGAVVRGAGLGLVAVSLGGWRFVRGLTAVAGAALLLGSYLLVGHPQASRPPTVEIAAQGVHVAAVSVWFGGVAYLGVELRRRRLGTSGPLAASALVVARFSRVAEVMVVLVLLSGAVLAEGQRMFTLTPWETAYGRALLVKLAFVGAVLAVGGYNRQRVVPAVARAGAAAAGGGDVDGRAWAHLRVTCALEALVIVLGVLLMTAAMTSGGI